MQSDGVPSVVEILHELIEALIKSEQWEEAVRVCDRCVDKHCKPSGINKLGRDVFKFWKLVAYPDKKHNT